LCLDFKRGSYVTFWSGKLIRVLTC
jgi:hypothetical protein